MVGIFIYLFIFWVWGGGDEERRRWGGGEGELRHGGLHLWCCHATVMRAAVIGLHIEGFCGAAGWANSQLDLSDGIESSSLPSLLCSSCSLCLLFFSDVFVCSSYSPFSPSLLWTSVLTNCASWAALIHRVASLFSSQFVFLAQGTRSHLSEVFTFLKYIAPLSVSSLLTHMHRHASP